MAGSPQAGPGTQRALSESAYNKSTLHVTPGGKANTAVHVLEVSEGYVLSENWRSKEYVTRERGQMDQQILGVRLRVPPPLN